MVIQIETEPNTFYFKQDLSADIGLSAIYSDSYIGLDPTVTLKSSDDTNIYVGQTTIPTHNDWQYGDGTVTQMYFSTYVNDIELINTHTAPWVDLYKLKDNISITEGNLVFTSGTVGKTVVFSSYIDYVTPWFVEDFDGVNKWFMESPDAATDKMIQPYDTNLLKIKRYQLFDAAIDGIFNTERDSNNIVMNRLTKAVGWLGRQIDTKVFDDNSSYENVILSKHNDGLYYPQAQRWYDINPHKDNDTFLSQLPSVSEYGKTKEEWYGFGAVDVRANTIMNTPQHHFDETFIAKCSQNNSFFYSVHQDHDVGDIKDQTLEGSGDNDSPLSYTYANLIQSDFGDGKSLHLKCFWENYSGSETGDEALSDANPFGYGRWGGAKTQDIVATVAGIPCPFPMDITTSGTSYPVSSAHYNPSYGPEIEIVLKINQMPVAPKCQDKAGGEYYFMNARAFTVMMKPKAPSGLETGIGIYQRNSAQVYPVINFLRTEASTGDVDVFCNGALSGSGGPMQNFNNVSGQNWAYYKKLSNVQRTKYSTKVPMGEWMKMRIKYNPFVQNNMIVYFENLTATGGTFKQAQVYTDGFGAGGFMYQPYTSWPSCLSLWTNNMRAINVSGGQDANHINYFLAVDDNADSDKIVDIEVDRIAFYGWNTITQNATVTKENPAPGLISIPAAMPIRPMMASSATPSINLEPGTQDGYYSKLSTFASSYISLGFDSKTNVSGSKFFHNGFFTPQPSEVLSIPYISGGYWYDDITGAGRTNYAGSKIGKEWFDNLPVGTTGTNDGIQIGGGTNYVDRLSYKGFIGVSSSFLSQGSANRPWVRTGNPIHQAKILTMSSDGTEITVDKPEIFDLPPGTRYVIENTCLPVLLDYKDYNNGTGSAGYLTPLYQEGSRKGNSITLSRSVLRGDKPGMRVYYSAEYWNPAASSSALPKLNISPYKYWINMQICNVSSTTGYASWWETATGTNTRMLARRNYTSLVPATGGDTYGTTFNEFLYDEGLSVNKWNIDLLNVSDTIVELQTDYGFGSVKEDETNNGTGYIRRDYVQTGQNYLDCTNFIDIGKPKPNSFFNFLLKPTFVNMKNRKYFVNIDTREGPNKTQMLFGIEDDIPVITTLNARPYVFPFEVPKEGQMMKLWSNIVLTWDETNKDTWYRLLFVDDKNISNKYHNTNFWAPLNETGTTFGYYTSQTDTTKTNFNNSGTLTSDIEGFMAYGAKFDGSDDYLVSSALHTLAIDGSSRWSFLAHCKPSAASGTIFDAYYTASQFNVALSSNRVVATHAASSKRLVSTNRYDCDGIQPLAIGVTYDQNIIADNWKLYVNGKLEDTKDYTSAISISGNIFIGASGNNTTSGSNLFTGFIEEITSYSGSTLYIPPNPKEYILNTTSYNDVVTGASTNDSVVYSSRLFVMDYHNIRGKSLSDVGRSPQAGWKVTGV